MKHIGQLILAISLLVFAVYLLTDSHGVVVYDCRLAEISPDIPIDVKEECRRIRLQEWQKQNIEKNDHGKYTT